MLTKGLLEILHCVQNDLCFIYSVILRSVSDEESAYEYNEILHFEIFRQRLERHLFFSCHSEEQSDEESILNLFRCEA